MRSPPNEQKRMKFVSRSLLNEKIKIFFKSKGKLLRTSIFQLFNDSNEKSLENLSLSSKHEEFISRKKKLLHLCEMLKEKWQKEMWKSGRKLLVFFPHKRQRRENLKRHKWIVEMKEMKWENGRWRRRKIEFNDNRGEKKIWSRMTSLFTLFLLFLWSTFHYKDSYLQHHLGYIILKNGKKREKFVKRKSLDKC